MYAKVGLHVYMSEADAMRLIAKHTTIPIPSVIDAIPVPTGAFIVMTRVPGEPLGATLMTMSDEECSLLASDLKKCFDQLRSIPAPSTGPRICGVGGGPFRCFRISRIQSVRSKLNLVYIVTSTNTRTLPSVPVSRNLGGQCTPLLTESVYPIMT